MLTLAFNIQPVKASGTPVHNIDSGLNYLTIQEAIDASETLGGHTILVDAGTYYEHVSVYKSLNLQGEDRETTIIDGGGSGNVVYITADWVNITGFTVRNGYYGFYLYGSSGDIISGNKITANNGGGICLDMRLVPFGDPNIYLYDFSHDVTISGNIVANNGGGIGFLHSCYGNTISGNNITANGGYGIYLDIWNPRCDVSGKTSSITGNNIVANNRDGIHLFYCYPRVTISGNNIVANKPYGIWIYYSSSKVFHNNFINNAKQAWSYESVFFWDNGYPSGGNYWSDYTGQDINGDGIGDTPYVIDIPMENEDRFPLMKPYGGPHDIGITSITTSKTVVGQGYTLEITVKILNYGIATETFNVTAYVNTTIIATLTNITLTSRNSATITFTWNTTGFAIGSYIISAYASPVPGETDTTDNTYVDGTVSVVDETPPATDLTIGIHYVDEVGNIYVSSATPFTLTAEDNPGGSGVASTAYRIYNDTYDSGWINYTQPFYLIGLSDCTYHIDYNSTDNAGNVETTHTINVTLFSWNYVFTDSHGRGTTLKINTAHKFFQFITPDKDYGIRNATYMLVYSRVVIICHRDSELKLVTLSVDTKIDFCVAYAKDMQTGKIYWLVHRPANWICGDIDCDGYVGSNDFAAFSGNYGKHW